MRNFFKNRIFKFSTSIAFSTLIIVSYFLNFLQFVQTDGSSVSNIISSVTYKGMGHISILFNFPQLFGTDALLACLNLIIFLLFVFACLIFIFSVILLILELVKLPSQHKAVCVFDWINSSLILCAFLFFITIFTLMIIYTSGGENITIFPQIGSFLTTGAIAFMCLFSPTRFQKSLRYVVLIILVMAGFSIIPMLVLS